MALEKHEVMSSKEVHSARPPKIANDNGLDIRKVWVPRSKKGKDVARTDTSSEL